VQMWELSSYSEAAKAAVRAIEMLGLKRRFRRQASAHILIAFSLGGLRIPPGIWTIFSPLVSFPPQDLPK
jgi:hypothetical protein